MVGAYRERKGMNIRTGLRYIISPSDFYLIYLGTFLGTWAFAAWLFKVRDMESTVGLTGGEVYSSCPNHSRCGFTSL